MKIYLIILIFVVTICSLHGQIVTIQFGATYYESKFKIPMHPEIIGKRIANDEYFFKLNYEHYINANFRLSGSYSKYPLSNSFYFYKENEGGSFGWKGSNVNRIDLNVIYDVFPIKKIILSPSVGFGFQISTPNGYDCICNGISGGIRPDNFELLTDIEAFTYSNTQIVPVIGLKFGYAFWGRLELFMDIQQVFGHKIIQELRMSYTYKGIEQPQAISYSDGTGRFYALGIGYRFVKPKAK